jgi:hypothetical protein
VAETTGSETETIEVELDAGTFVLAMFGSLVFFAFCLWMALNADTFSKPLTAALSGWAGVGLFGAMVLLAPGRLADLRRGPVLTISPEGIQDRRFSDQTVPWEEIIEVTEWSYRSTRSIRLILEPSLLATIELKPLARSSQGFNKLFGIEGMLISAMALRISHQELLRTVWAYHQYYGSIVKATSA